MRILSVAVCMLMHGCSSPKAPPSHALHQITPPREFVPPFAYEAYVRGELALAQGDVHGAALQLEMATAAPYEDAYLLSRLAAAQAAAGDTAAAEQSLREAERVNGCEQNVWLTKGRWAEARKDAAAAIAAYERARSCDPQALSATLALARVLSQEGEAQRGLVLLTDLSKHGNAQARAAALAHALAGEGAGEVRFALASWLDSGVLDRSLIEAAQERALQKREPALLAEMARSQGLLTPQERAELLTLTLDREGLRALVAQSSEGELGGAEAAARYALLARDYERAELYAALALQRNNHDELQVLRARALSALADAQGALEALRAVVAPATRTRLAREQLDRLGMPALSRELEGNKPAQ